MESKAVFFLFSVAYLICWFWMHRWWSPCSLRIGFPNVLASNDFAQSLDAAHKKSLPDVFNTKSKATAMNTPAFPSGQNGRFNFGCCFFFHSQVVVGLVGQLYLRLESLPSSIVSQGGRWLWRPRFFRPKRHVFGVWQNGFRVCGDWIMKSMLCGFFQKERWSEEKWGWFWMIRKYEEKVRQLAGNGWQWTVCHFWSDYMCQTCKPSICPRQNASPGATRRLTWHKIGGFRWLFATQIRVVWKFRASNIYQKTLR